MEKSVQSSADSSVQKEKPKSVKPFEANVAHSFPNAAHQHRDHGH
jgi:hypothetical protein